MKSVNVENYVSRILLALFIAYANVYVFNYLYHKYSKRLAKGKLFDMNTIENTLVSMSDFMLLSIFVFSAFKSINICKACVKN